MLVIDSVCAVLPRVALFLAIPSRFFRSLVEARADDAVGTLRPVYIVYILVELLLLLVTDCMEEHVNW